MTDTTRAALEAARDQFRMYADEHRMKAQPDLDKAAHYRSSGNGEMRVAAGTFQTIADRALAKAKTNDDMADRMDKALAALNAGDTPAETAFGPADAPGLPLGLRRHPRYALRVAVTATSDADEQGDGGPFTYPDLVTFYAHRPQEIAALAAVLPAREVDSVEVWRNAEGRWCDASATIDSVKGLMVVPASRADDLLAKIDQWGRDRNIIGEGTALQQLPKLISEVGELADDGIGKGDRNALIDGIGDTIVVLAMIAGIEGVTITKCLAHAYDEIKDRTGVLFDGIFVKSTDPRYHATMAKLAERRGGAAGFKVEA